MFARNMNDRINHKKLLGKIMNNYYEITII